MKVTTIINSGHSEDDPGAMAFDGTGKTQENILMMQLRDRLKSRIPNALYVPDDLNLRKSIEWVNERAEHSDFALSLHLNSHVNSSVRGVEVYYDTDFKIAQEFARAISEATGLPNRGARHQSESYVGKLGWLEQLKCPSILIEVCYLSNPTDKNFIFYPSNQEKVVDGIMIALHRDNKELQQGMNDLWRQFRALLALFKSKFVWK